MPAVVEPPTVMLPCQKGWNL